MPTLTALLAEPGPYHQVSRPNSRPRPWGGRTKRGEIYRPARHREAHADRRHRPSHGHNRRLEMSTRLKRKGLSFGLASAKVHADLSQGRNRVGSMEGRYMLNRMFSTRRYRLVMLSICCAWLTLAFGAARAFACWSGGPNSSSCSAAGSGCSVTCDSGYYACCDGANALSRCTCIKAPPAPPGQ